MFFFIQAIKHKNPSTIDNIVAILEGGSCIKQEEQDLN